MRFDSLSQWLAWQEQLHFTEIDPGLERVGKVWQRMGGSSQLPFTVITVAGTNGKGSSVALLASILKEAGYTVGTYTSPHLMRYNERIRINNTQCADQAICKAFDRIDSARGDISLTYFEFATLAAADIFTKENIDIAVLEVGMGGRLDAVNLFDADIAMITPVSLDHTAWLGDNREQIGREKAGIIRPQHPVVCTESSPPQSVIERANDINAPVFLAGRDFAVEAATDEHWTWHNAEQRINQLPMPALKGSYQLQNSAAVLQVISLLNQQGFTISHEAMRTGLKRVKLAGRFQVVHGPVTRIFDVTHNQQGAINLYQLLQEFAIKGKTFAVLAMLGDKDVVAVATSLRPVIDNWFIAGLEGSRGMDVKILEAKLADHIDAEKIFAHQSVIEAYQHAMSAAKEGDRILVFGSFHTVEAVMQQLPELAETI